MNKMNFLLIKFEEFKGYLLNHDGVFNTTFPEHINLRIIITTRILCTV